MVNVKPGSERRREACSAVPKGLPGWRVGCATAQTSCIIRAALKSEERCHGALYAAIKQQKLGAAEPESTLQVAFVCFPMIPQPALHFCQVFTFLAARLPLPHRLMVKYSSDVPPQP